MVKFATVVTGTQLSRRGLFERAWASYTSFVKYMKPAIASSSSQPKGQTEQENPDESAFVDESAIPDESYYEPRGIPDDFKGYMARRDAEILNVQSRL